ncbi:MAG: tRNA (adenosine(37)-N6)-threonylcarbamoyltransferase complex dimerization subunit type 1 TsaB [Proteobacteria bacterium]|nr:tRNA (adenosine(37)-N6)-threonylcarbamoyltransferase complex dimerization subunit type 1 TsaB [Pseudomonadota bacterium]
MKVLGINTATIFGSIGLVSTDRVLGEYSLNTPITHSERLMNCIDGLLADTRVHIEEVDGFSITLGPGSFTGLRIGVSTVKGLAFATGRPVTGVSTLEALAFNLFGSQDEICPILDARKNEVYAALFKADGSHRLKRLTPDMVISPQDLVKQIHGKVAFLGDGVDVYGSFLRRKLGRRASLVAPELGYVHGAVVAHMGLRLMQRGKTLEIASLVPHYVRRSEAEIKYDDMSKKETEEGVFADGRKNRGSRKKTSRGK